MVIGHSSVSKRDLLSVSCNKSFLDDDFDFELSEPDKYDYSKLKNSRKYEYVLVDPISHKQRGGGKSNSMIREMEENESKTKIDWLRATAETVILVSKPIEARHNITVEMKTDELDLTLAKHFKIVKTE